MNGYTKALLATLAVTTAVLLGSYLMSDGVRARNVTTPGRADIPYTFVYVEELNDKALTAMPLFSPVESTASFISESKRLLVQTPGFVLPPGSAGLILHEVRNNDVLLTSSLIPAQNTPIIIKDRDLTVIATDPLRPAPAHDIVVNSRRLVRGDLEVTFLDGGKVKVVRDGEAHFIDPGQHWLVEAGGYGNPRSRLLVRNAGIWSSSRLTTLRR